MVNLFIGLTVLSNLFFFALIPPYRFIASEFYLLEPGTKQFIHSLSLSLVYVTSFFCEVLCLFAQSYANFYLDGLLGNECQQQFQEQ